MDNNKSLIGTTVITALAASLCCITPVLAFLAGTTGVASTFSFIEPFRPYLVGITILALVFAWYQKMRPRTQEEIDCACEAEEKPSFWQSKKFLAVVTIFAVIMLAFPYYSHIFYPTTETSKEVVYVSENDVDEVSLSIKGMTCSGCEAHIESEVNKLDGILMVKSDYQKANTVVKYDGSRTTAQEIKEAILRTGYTINK
ncbi:mercuric transport protein MerTP [Maribacter arenosus]|uniref:Mercuric transport protein MerT n=1 Tax=Maribacter arenosus TaxID=1854708 RepID=A0ABR7VI84_9FLAO|nr:mercuric transport protein MerTP [Maribacter arenosus]MBD0851852.1 mercuric transport protein MerTP [Maribacter arenosus]